MPLGQAVEALGQQPLPDENTDAVMGAHSNGKKACYLFKHLIFKPIFFQVSGPSRDVIQAQRGAALEGNQWLRSL